MDGGDGSDAHLLCTLLTAMAKVASRRWETLAPRACIVMTKVRRAATEQLSGDA
jgi:hypothetical protein